MRGSIAPEMLVKVGCVTVKIVVSAAVSPDEFKSESEYVHDPLLIPLKLITDAVV